MREAALANAAEMFDNHPVEAAMSDIFISYAHEDQPFVLMMAEKLQAEGFSVWWDHAIPPGKSWDDVIAAGIQNAKACIVVWSKNSIESEWVKEEATMAREARKYLPVSVDDSLPPMGFRRIQAAHLDNWTGDPNDSQWRLLATEAKSMLSARGAGEGAAPPPANPVYHAPPQSAPPHAAQTPPIRPAYQAPPVRSATGAPPNPSAAVQSTSATGTSTSAGGIPKPLIVAVISGVAVFLLLSLGSFMLNRLGSEKPVIAGNTIPPPISAPAFPGASANAESIVASAGQWLAGAPNAPANPAGYYMVANDNYGHAGYVGMGSIVVIRSCDSVNCQVNITYGHGSNACDGWYVIPTDMTYLGDTYDPSWQAISDQLYPRDTHQAQLATRCAP